MSSSWQDACGVVSAYGLIFDVLRANDGLASYPASSGQKFNTPITVHWVYSTSKSSPNRCIPTNQSALWNGNAVMATQANTPGSNTGIWNDGCDFVVDGSVSNTVPITQVTNSDTTLSSTKDTVAITFDTTNGSNAEYPTNVGPYLAFPNFLATQVKVNTTTPSSSVNIVRYGGGAFVINSTDVTAFLALVSGLESHKDTNGNAVDFSPFRTSGTYTAGATSKTHGCAITQGGYYKNAAFSTNDTSGAFGETGTITGYGNQLAYANEHFVTIHRAALSFTAYDTQHWNTRPPRIALLQTVGGLFNQETPDYVATTGVKGAQLKYYLRSAGLDFTGSSGCPAGGFNTTTSVYNPETGSTNKATFCPNGGTSGQIYDFLDAIDVANGLLSNYQIFWAPHFHQPCFSAAATSCGASPYCCGQYTCGSACDATTTPIPTACVASPFSNSNTCITAAETAIGQFIAQQNRGVFGECSSIGTFEGVAYDATSYVPSPNLDAGPLEQALTCVNDGTGACSTTKTALGVNIDQAATTGVRLDNCDNPVQPSDNIAPAYCIYYNPGYDFAQIGDFRWFAAAGLISNYGPASGSTYTSGSVRLGYGVAESNASGITVATGPSQSFADIFSFAQKTANSAAVVYLGGHNYTADVAGTRVALNTVLSLGLSVSSTETAFVGATLYKTSVFVPSYYEVTTTRPPDSWQTYNVSSGSQWHFPYHAGELRIHTLQTTTSTQAYSDNVVSSASTQFPHITSGTSTNEVDSITNIPANRNLFTYLGGAVTTTGVPSQIPNLVAQSGWLPVNFDESQITSTSTCVDKFHIGPVGPNTATNKPAYAGMVAGKYASGAKVCDLQEALEVNVPLSALGSDYGASTAEQTAISADLTAQTAINTAIQLVRMVRGYCFSTVNGVDGSSTPSATPYNPASLTCNNKLQYGSAPNGANGGPTLDYLGGFVHSQVAVIPDSPYIVNTGGKARPTVAYVGGLDGQLHAFYVPRGDGLESGYTGPVTAPATLTGTAASTVFPTSYSSGFSTSTAALTELWSFIPPGQLPYLQTNQAQVDSSPAVIDVFGDFAGTGIRTWHTVLIASAGGSNRELFALDITNPLAPIMLWDLESSYPSTIPYAPVPLTDDDTALNTSTGSQATLWHNNCRLAQETPLSDGGIPCTPAKYVLPSSLDTGASATGVYNYIHLGASQSVSVAELRNNGQPQFAAFVGTNEPGGNGVYVFAIDLVTGQKLWEWSSPYDTVNMPSGQASGVGNTAPAGVTLFSKTGDNLIDTVYVGDDAGNLWELDAQDGVSQTGYGVALSCSSGACNYALSDAYGIGANGPQPISTLATLFYVPTTTLATSQFYNYAGQTLLAYGTGGTDTITALSSIPNGAIHVLPVASTGRYQASAIAANSALRTTATNYGVAKEVNGYPQYLTNGQRVYGSIVATNDTLYFNATSGAVTGIDNHSSTALLGSTYSLTFAAATASAGISSLSSGNGAIGGTVAVSTGVTGQTTVVAVTGQKIVTTVVPNTNLVASTHAINNVGATPTGLLGWILRKTGHDY